MEKPLAKEDHRTQPEMPTFVVGWTVRRGGPHSHLPEQEPTLLEVTAPDVRSALQLRKREVPGGGRFVFAVETKGVVRRWDHTQLKRLDLPDGTLLCISCGSNDIGPFRDGQDPDWVACRKCGQEMNREQAQGR